MVDTRQKPKNVSSNPVNSLALCTRSILPYMNARQSHSDVIPIIVMLCNECSTCDDSGVHLDASQLAGIGANKLKNALQIDEKESI
jgi:hypothetical protein